MNLTLSLTPHRNTPPAQALVHEFESWASVQADRALQFDWDDALGNAARREAGLRLERMRQVSSSSARATFAVHTGSAHWQRLISGSAD